MPLLSAFLMLYAACFGFCVSCSIKYVHFGASLTSLITTISDQFVVEVFEPMFLYFEVCT